MDALEALTTRASPLKLGDPAPDRAALDAMLRAAARAPDHGRLHPWRFIVIESEARRHLGEVLAAAIARREPDAPEALIAKERDKPLRAPLVVVVAAHVIESRKIPAVEQIIAAGAAAQNILVAAHALGYGGFWRTGPAAYDDAVKKALGLKPADAIVGFLYLGTPLVPSPPPPPADLAAFVTEWSGPAKEDADAT
jgi:nitroreductase